MAESRARWGEGDLVGVARVVDVSTVDEPILEVAGEARLQGRIRRGEATGG